jgi:hypothetical protein
MKCYLFIAFLVASLICNVRAQDHRDVIKHTAQLMADAMVKQDYLTASDYFYPKIVELQGGRDSILEHITTYLKNKNSDGLEFKITSAIIGEPDAEIKIDEMLYSVVPEKLVLRINGSNYETIGFLIGISADKGQHWWFGDAAGLEELEEVLPDVKRLTIPKSARPVKLSDNR